MKHLSPQKPGTGREIHRSKNHLWKPASGLSQRCRAATGGLFCHGGSLPYPNRWNSATLAFIQSSGRPRNTCTCPPKSDYYVSLTHPPTQGSHLFSELCSTGVFFSYHLPQERLCKQDTQDGTQSSGCKQNLVEKLGAGGPRKHGR